MANEVIINIGNIKSKIIGYIPDVVQETLNENLSYQLADIEYAPRVKLYYQYLKNNNGKIPPPELKFWDGYTRLYNKNRGQEFYTGLLGIVLEVLAHFKIPFVKKDSRIIPEQNMPDLKFTPSGKYKERDYQQACLNLGIKATRGIFKIATGGGKTLLVTELIGRLKTGPFFFYVLTKDLLNQAHETLSTYLNVPIGKIGGGECKIEMINVCTIQTAIRAINLGTQNFNLKDYSFDEEDSAAWKDEELTSVEQAAKIRQAIQAAKGIFVDECHHTASKTILDVINASPYAYWKYGGSATPYREDGADLMIRAMFGKNIVDINASYLIERGFLCEPYIFFVPIAHEIRLQAYKTIYKDCIANNTELNAHVADTTNFLIKNGLTTLILVEQISQGKLIQKFIPEAPFVSGKAKDRESTINDLRNGKIKTMIATTLADEGLDVPTLDAVIMAGGGASATRVNQRIGRTLRINPESTRRKSVAIYYEHKAKYLMKHAAKVKKILKLEPKFNILTSSGPEYIKNEISEVMNLSQDSDGIFD